MEHDTFTWLACYSVTHLGNGAVNLSFLFTVTCSQS